MGEASGESAGFGLTSSAALIAIACLRWNVDPCQEQRRFAEIRRDVVEWLLASKGERKVAVKRKLVLPDIEPEDLSVPRGVFNRRKSPLRRREIKRETVEVQ